MLRNLSYFLEMQHKQYVGDKNSALLALKYFCKEKTEKEEEHGGQR